MFEKLPEFKYPCVFFNKMMQMRKESHETNFADSL